MVILYVFAAFACFALSASLIIYVVSQRRRTHMSTSHLLEWLFILPSAWLGWMEREEGHIIVAGPVSRERIRFLLSVFHRMVRSVA
jgi:hypothetical protein